MKKKIFVGVLIVLLVVVGAMFFSFDKKESDRELLKEYLGYDKVKLPNVELDCKIFEGSGLLKKTAVVLIHGHGESLGSIEELALEIVVTGRTAIVCQNYGFKENEIEEWKWMTYLLLWNGASYQGLMVKTYNGVVNGLKEKGFEEVILVGFSMGSHIAMYTGALSDEIDYTIGISGLSPYNGLFNDAPTLIIPEIFNDFTMGDISCMNKKMTWLQGLRDTVYPYVAAKLVSIPCDNVDLKSFERLDDTGGGHRIPNNLVIDLLEKHEASNK